MKSPKLLSKQIAAFCKKINVKDLPHQSELTRNIRIGRFHQYKGSSRLSKKALRHVYNNVLDLDGEESFED